MQWQQVANVAMEDMGNWQLVTKQSGMTLESAQAFAEASDAITCFFFVRSPLALPAHGTFVPNDAVFFSGVPWWGSAPEADGYVKPAPTSQSVEVAAPLGNGWTFFEAQVNVPLVPPSQGFIFLWPGLQPGLGRTYNPIGNGVLQPVLTFGTNDGPNPNQLQTAGHWWISGQYYNGTTQPVTWAGGDRMIVNPGDVLLCILAYDAASLTWNQTIINTSSMQDDSTVSFGYSLATAGVSQEQNRAEFYAEDGTSQSFTQSVSLYSVVLKVASPAPGLDDSLRSLPYVSGVKLSSDNMTLNVDRIVIYSPAIVAPNSALRKTTASAPV